MNDRSRDGLTGQAVRNDARVIFVRLIGKRMCDADADDEYQPQHKKDQHKRPVYRDAHLDHRGLPIKGAPFKQSKAALARGQSGGWRGGISRGR